MLIYEFRVVIPMTVDEYHVAQLWSVAKASQNETGGGEGVEVITNEPFKVDENPSQAKSTQPLQPLLDNKNAGQFTHKIFHLASKVPTFIRWLAPTGSLEIHEQAWNAFPYCRTIITNPDYMKDNFLIKIESMHLKGPPTKETENVHQLDAEQIKKRKVVVIDIANDPVSSKDYKADEDPRKFKSEKTGRGPLPETPWFDNVQPVMTCYKLVTCEFKWWGLQGRVENLIMKVERRVFTNFHRQVFCWTDKWYGLTMKDIRDLEEKTKRDLDEARQKGEVRGIKEE